MNLTDSELVILDGKCSSEVQLAVDAAKARLAMASSLGIDAKLAGFIADAVTEATQNGLLICRHVNLRNCRVCGKSAGYAIRKRSGRYHRVGTPNHDRPLTFAGKELAERFITFQGHASLGCCNECFEKAKPFLKSALAGVRAEISETLTDKPAQFKKWDNKQCVCGWAGDESQMGRIRTLMGDGYYAGKCPKCGAENLFLGPTNIKSAPGFTIVPVTAT